VSLRIPFHRRAPSSPEPASGNSPVEYKAFIRKYLRLYPGSFELSPTNRRPLDKKVASPEDVRAGQLDAVHATTCNLATKSMRNPH